MSKINEIKKLEDLSKVISFKIKTLTYLLYIKKPESFYTTFYREKKNGEKREINAPSGLLLAVQKNLARQLEKLYLDKFPNNNIAHAFIPGKSIYTNTLMHIKKKYIIHADLKDFFSSFHFGRVKGFFEKNKSFMYDNKLSIQISNLLCFNGKLPQGAPTSPIITNFICQAMDYHISKLSKKYHLIYSRYADDLIFSSNDKKVMEYYDEFYDQLKKVVGGCGFIINEDKTNFAKPNDRHLVTGLVINKKINFPLEFYRKTRAMAYFFYKNNYAFCDDVQVNKHVIEGRFSFIKQVMKWNKAEQRIKGALNPRLNEYRKFIFYTKFYNLDKPLLITEGPTDIKYIKAALINYKLDYPTLIKEIDGRYVYSFSSFNRTKNIVEFFKCSKEGADAITNLTRFFYDIGPEVKDKKFYVNFYYYFSKICNFKPKFPIICIYDNELGDKNKPIYKLKNEAQLSFDSNISCILNNTNMYILPIPKNNAATDIEIEDLLPDEILKIELEGRTFDRKDKTDSKTTFGKKVLSNYVYDNAKTINFEKFKPLLNEIKNIIGRYK